MQSWAAEELHAVDLGDPRRNRRLLQLVEALAAHPAASVPEACHSWAATKAAYRFWDNPHVSPEAIRQAHSRTTREALALHATVLVIQDTTELDFTAHPHTRGLGPLSHRHCRGLHVHSALVATEAGVPLGLIHQEVWARDPARVGTRHARRQRPTADKESQRWLTALSATQASLPEGVETITLADREADLYDLFALPRPPGSHLLIRATHNRRVVEESQYLWSAISAALPAGQLTVTVGRRGDQPEREACLRVRFCSVTIRPPRHHPRRGQLAPIGLQAILAEEEAPPAGGKAVKWLLLTTLPVRGVEEAIGCVQRYSQRWLVERYHLVLKSGCRLEALQLETGERLQRALATYSIVAWRLLWLTYEARQDPLKPCDQVLEPAEWQALSARIQQTREVPAEPPTLREAVRWIAQLGGFLGRRGDGEPGVQTLWKGMRHLHDMVATWQILTQPPPHGLMGNA
jgi:Transposase DNA-binding/Transposase Tn5 dimerisation domain